MLISQLTKLYFRVSIPQFCVLEKSKIFSKMAFKHIITEIPKLPGENIN